MKCMDGHGRRLSSSLTQIRNDGLLEVKPDLSISEHTGYNCIYLFIEWVLILQKPVKNTQWPKYSDLVTKK